MTALTAIRRFVAVRIRRSRCPFRVLCWLLVLILSSVAATAQGNRSASTHRQAQFVFVIDDSGSMSLEAFGRTDPNRLAVFAVRAILGVLDDGDWATVIRLNGPRDGEEPPPLAPLTDGHRRRLEQALDLAGPLAAYRGEYTPCRSALDAARRLLEASDRRELSQVVLFLSDGACTPEREDQVLGFVEGLSAHEDDGRLQLYLLRFQGTRPSPELERLAEVTGGSAIEVQRGDPTRILNTFAEALSRSQGYESQILTPQKPGLPAHRGARRIRLLAVARGSGPELEINVTDDAGIRLPVKAIDQALHRFLPDGQEYRFASASYQPMGSPVHVSVVGAGDAWEAVALPEYRLKVDLELHRGSCEVLGDVLTGDVVGAGTGLCAVLRLINDFNQVVGQNVTEGKLEGVIELAPSDGTEPRVVTATPRNTIEASFQLPLKPPAGIHYTIRAALQVMPKGGGRPLVLSADPRTLLAEDRAINARPARIDFGDLYPGDRDTPSLTLVGNFPETTARVGLADRDATVECVALQFAGQPLGTLVRIRSGQSYPVHVEVAEDCPRAGVFPVHNQLLVRFAELPGADEVSVPLDWRLDNTVKVGQPVSMVLDAGNSARARVEIAGDAMPRGYHAQLDPVEDSSGALASELTLGFLDHRGDLLLGEDGEPHRESQFDMGATAPLDLAVEAGSCCADGVYESQLRLRPVDGGPARLFVLSITVRGSWWTCYRSWVWAGLIGLLIALLTFYVLSMFTHSHFLRRKQLASRLVPLRWPRYGGAPQPASDRAGDRVEVEDMVNDGLPRSQRVLNWFRANPLVFGLPGRRYHETVDLLLAPDLGLTSVMLVPECDVVGRLRAVQAIESWEEGRLFARAGSGVSFLAVRGPKKEVCQMAPDDWYGSVDDLSVEVLAKGQRFIHKIPTKDRKESFVAGWVLE